MNDDDPMPFGKYKGCKMQNVPASYLDWLRDQPWLKDWPQVAAYIAENARWIDKELQEE